MKQFSLHKTQFESNTIEIALNDIAACVIKSWMSAAYSFMN